MIKSANQYPVHSLLSHEGNTLYRVPPYQREYTWQKGQWEELFDDLLEAEGAHFLGTIITLNQTQDVIDANVLEVIDGQQRLTTLTLLMAASHSVLQENIDDLDEEQRIHMSILRMQLVRRSDRSPRVRPQRQGSNLADYEAILTRAGLGLNVQPTNYMPLRRISRCFEYFRSEIRDLAERQEMTEVEAGFKVLDAAKKAVIVKIEVANHADAFVLFESLNNRGMPLTPVDLIKNHLLAESERHGVMDLDQAFDRWNEMLRNLGDSYANQERFLRHYYNAFKFELPTVPRATVATRANLIRIHEALIAPRSDAYLDRIIPASALYGRITGVSWLSEYRTNLDDAFLGLSRVQGAPSYVLLLWLLSKQRELELTDEQLAEVTHTLVSFFVRRNLTGTPPTYALPKLFMTIIDRIDQGQAEDRPGGPSDVLKSVGSQLLAASVDDEAFRSALLGPIYEDNTDIARFILATLAEDQMTRETSVDLWERQKNKYVWTIEHILPQGIHLPQDWVDMLGGPAAAENAQARHVHQIGNLTISRYNSSLSNKSFQEKRDRVDSQGRPIGYRNGLSLNSDLANRDTWTVEDIEERTNRLADLVVQRFRLGDG